MSTGEREIPYHAFMGGRELDDERTVNTGGEIRSILPQAAAQILKDAAATPLDATASDPGFSRRKALDRAHAQVKTRWPQFFRD